VNNRCLSGANVDVALHDITEREAIITSAIYARDLTKQLDEAIITHEKITSYMMTQSLYHPFNVNEQIQLDLQNIQTAINIPS
jgi:hypothetical protein